MQNIAYLSYIFMIFDVMRIRIIKGRRLQVFLIFANS
jgi:hypothetical protein